MVKEATGYAHGKIILMGEHSVVYNKPAIALPLNNIKMQATVISDSTLNIECDFYKGLIETMPELLSSLQTLIFKILKYIHKENATFKIILKSKIPIERGMGSSAAVAVATTRAIFKYFNLALSNETLLNLVNISETIAHKTPSGIDALMTSSNLPYYFVKNETPIPIHMNLNSILIVADTGITGQTKLAVQNIKSLITTNDEAKKLISKLGNLTLQAQTAMENNESEKLGKYMTLAHDCLTKLNVSNERLDILVDTALSNGAYGAKLTGGGLGGCMIVLCKDELATQIEQKLLASGAKKTWLLNLKGAFYDKNNS